MDETKQPNVSPQADSQRPNAVPGVPVEPTRVNEFDALTKDDLEAQFRWAMYQMAVKLAVVDPPQEHAQLAESILKMAQATVILDPEIVAPQGVLPDALQPGTPRIPMDKGAPSTIHAAGG